VFSKGRLYGLLPQYPYVQPAGAGPGCATSGHSAPIYPPAHLLTYCAATPPVFPVVFLSERFGKSAPVPSLSGNPYPPLRSQEWKLGFRYVDGTYQPRKGHHQGLRLHSPGGTRDPLTPKIPFVGHRAPVLPPEKVPPA